MRFNIALVHSLGRVTALHHHVGGPQRFSQIAARIVMAARHVRRLGRLGVHAFGEEVIVQQWRTGRSRLFHVDHVGQDLIDDLDPAKGFLSNRRGGRSDGRDGVALVERLVPRHHVQGHVALVGRLLAALENRRGQVGEVRRGNHGLHAGKGAGPGRVDADDARVGMRAAQDTAHQLARHVEVRAIGRAACDLVRAVGPDRSGANDLEGGFLQRLAHATFSWRSSAAASMTARMILSYPVQRQRLPANQ